MLGTAQLGLDYGIANKKGKPGFDEAFDIVKTAWDEGIRFFDTAQAYGDSESVLGRCLRKIRKAWPDSDPCVITKLRPDVDPRDPRVVLEELDASIERLGVEKLWGFMFHREVWVDMDRRELSTAVARIKNKGKVGHVGVSVYSLEKAMKALDIDGIDIVQLPFNVFDQRAREKGVFDFAEKRGKTVFVRSTYLQGLLILTPDQIPAKMNFCADKLKTFQSLAEKSSISPKLAAIAFVVHHAPGSFLVLGAESAGQVRENCSLCRKASTTDLPDLTELACNDPRLINPSFWNEV